jgi:hypothetical protein
MFSLDGVWLVSNSFQISVIRVLIDLILLLPLLFSQALLRPTIVLSLGFPSSFLSINIVWVIAFPVLSEGWGDHEGRYNSRS